MESLALAFIFRDDAVTIADMLDSLMPHVDEIVAVDTGSSDGSRAIVEEKLQKFQGKRLLEDFQWDGRDDPNALLPDFSAARQFGWDQVTSDWAIWADADDVVEGADAFRRLINEPSPYNAFVFAYDYAQTPSGACVCTLNRERLMKTPQDWYWVSPVHEVLAPKNPAGAQYTMCDLAIWRHRKQPKPIEGDRNLVIIEGHIAKAKADGVPADPRMLVYYGVELAARGRHEDAIKAYQEYMGVAQWGEEKHQAMHRMADSLRALGSLDEALQVETYAMTHAAPNQVPEWADHLNGIGETLLAQGHHAHAIEWFERGLKLGMPQSSLILNPRDYDYLPRFHLALCYAQLGRFEDAMRMVDEAHAVLPDDPALQQNARAIISAKAQNDAALSTISFLETLIRFDENLKARQAIRYIPYAVKADPRVRALIHHIRTSTFQVGDAAGYEKMYATNREVRNPDEMVADASLRLSRVAHLAAGLREQAQLPEVDTGNPPTDPEEAAQWVADAIEMLSADVPTDLKLLDAGCNDGWVAAHIESVLHLAECDGIDLNPTAIEAAVKRAADFGLSGRYETGFVEEAADRFGESRYDAIAMFEVFEHLEDPDRSVGELERALKVGGRMYISTPIGAYEKGVLHNWQTNTAKQHLRAVPMSEFAQFAMRRGWLTGMTAGPDGVQTVSYKPQAKKGRVVIYAGPMWEPWSPLDIDARGLGGSETAIVKVAEGLAEAGFLVEVYGGLSIQGPLRNVLYRPEAEFDPDEHCELFVAWRGVSPIDLQPSCDQAILWLHDAVCPGLKERIDRFGRVWCLSDAHELAVRTAAGITDEEWDGYFGRTANGIDLARYPDGNRSFEKRTPTVVYSSSPDRGLEKLLDLWPKIRAKVPKAKLDVYYGFDIFDKMHGNNPGQQAWKNQLLKRMEKLPGVTFKGRANQADLAAAQQSARVWAYPYAYDNPTETSCITAMEAMAAGLFAVTTDSGALSETLGEGGFALPRGLDGSFPDGAFIHLVTDGLKDPQLFKAQQNAALRRADELTWDRVVDQWVSEIEGMVQVGS